MKKLLVVALLGLAACERSPEEKAAIRELFNECVEKSNSIKEGGFRLFNTKDDVITRCEAYAIRNF